MSKCGTCKKEFANDDKYLSHKCTTGFKPTDIQHQDALTNGRFSRIAAKAIERGEERK